MLGLVRTTLALMVMVNHLFIGISPLGGYAVFGFFIISGYLMTLIMHESYGYTWFGRLSFAVNRFLRLFPQYWASAAISVLLIYFLGSETVVDYHKTMFLPTTIKEYISNISLIYPTWFPGDFKPRLVPTTWALTIEIFYYFLICLGLSKNFNRVKVWFLLSVLYVFASFIPGVPPVNTYPFASGSLPFSIGSAIYFISKNNEVYQLYLKSKISTRLVFILMLVNGFIWTALSKTPIGWIEFGGYLNLLVCTLLIYGVVKGGKIFQINKPLDNFIGDFSYPVYLLHWQIGLIVSLYMYGEAFHEYSVRGGINLMVTLVPVCLLSIIFMFIIDKPIQLIRSRIKANKALAKGL